MLEYLPLYVERALAFYRTAFAELPGPERPFDTYLFAQREQWQRQTRSLMKERAELYLNLGRGGYSTRGTAVLYDIGMRDTLAILAHEGWHQYTQITFKNPLPTWLEEGLATYMEGRRRTRYGSTFDPWRNAQRSSTLREGLNAGRLIDLDKLVTGAPQQFLREDEDGLLMYYAQVWALSLFITEGEDGKYASALKRLLEDAVHGRVGATLASSSALTPTERRRGPDLNGRGIIRAYFNEDWDEFAGEYDRFMQQIVRGDRPEPPDES